VRENRFKAAIAARERQIGMWTCLASPMVAEMVGTTSGLDWFVIDMEHSPNEIPQVLTQLQASQHGHAEAVVRVPWNEPVVVKRVLDLGAQSLIFPYVQTAEEAAAAVASTRYPPEGVRGVMSIQRMNNYGTQLPDYYRLAHTQICNILQVETIGAVERIAEIGAVPGVDALFIGPSDLAASMGHIGNPGHPEVRAAIELAIAKIAECGLPSGFLSAKPEDCRWVLEKGVSFCAVGSDLQMLAASTRAAAKDFKSFVKTLPK
jgi:4-hydroxy-2-oxoheptanedioate aldolase